ncbi:MFS transporter [Variovorax sp. GB1P17]|uniref:MFS transporter n=1 Tax=Variovorax sp. GB1P17 TaxID=3443740 RepID=UPI003F4513D5
MLAAISQPLHRRLAGDKAVGSRIQWRAVLDPIAIVIRHTTLRRLALCSQLFTVAQLLVAAYSVTYLHETLGMDLVVAGAILSAAQAGGVAGRIAWGYVCDIWLGARNTIITLAALMALGAFTMAALQTTPPFWFVALVMLAFGTAAIGWNGVYLAEVARAAPPGAAGVATSDTLGFTFLANVLAPIGISLIAQYFGGLRTAYALLGVPLLITCALFIRIKVASSSELSKR